MNWNIAAPDAVAGITGGQILGTITMSGLALAATIALFLGLRGSDRIKLNTRDKVGGGAIVTGTLWMAAGGTWADMATGVSSIPTSILGPGSGLGDPGAGGIALALALLTFGPRWKNLWIPAFLGIASAVTFGVAGGLGKILVNVILMAFGQITGAA